MVDFFLERLNIEKIISIPFNFLCKRAFKFMGSNSYISPNCQIIGMKYIGIGKNSKICKNSRILALNKYNLQIFTPSIQIGNNVSVGFNCVLSCINSIEIMDDVTIGDNVYISDNKHSYQNPTMSVIDQPLEIGSTIIGKGCWIGYGAVLAGNIKIGKYSIVGANSVVTKDVNDYTMVVGSPAKVVKYYDHLKKTWEK